MKVLETAPYSSMIYLHFTYDGDFQSAMFLKF